MKRRIIVISIIVGLFVLLQAGTISLRGGNGNSRLQNVEQDYPVVGHLKSTLNRLFDTGFSLQDDMHDPNGDWAGDEDIVIFPPEIRVLEIRTSDRPVRILKLQNDDDATVNVVWQPQADPNAAWWDVTAMTFPDQKFKLQSDDRQTVIVMKGGGTIEFVSHTGQGMLRFTNDH